MGLLHAVSMPHTWLMLGSGGWPGWGEETFSKGFGGCVASLAHTPHPPTHPHANPSGQLSLLHFLPHEQHFLTTYLQALDVSSLPKEPSCLDFTPLSRSQQFLWFYQEVSRKPQTSAVWKLPTLLPCPPPSTQAHSPSCSGNSFHVPSHAWEGKGAQMQCSWEAGCPTPLGFFGDSC